MPAPSHLPIVAIVGRPNVGKSTLFNRFAGHRRALVEDRPGITRDRIVEEVEAAGRRVLLVDTAGLDPVADSDLDAAVQDQARAALDEADAVLLVVDGQAGLLPPDRELARLLRRTRKPVAVAVNKIDVPGHRHRVAEFHALGLEPLEGISAEHGSGAWDLLEALVERLAAPQPGSTEPEADEPALRVALVGRPNAGKSSLLNRLIGEERVVVSEVPGTTRDAVDTRLERPEGAYVFVDTAGLRRPGRRDRIAEQASAMMTLRAVERASVALVVVDAEDGFSDQDAKIVSLVRQRGCAAALALNKWDLVEKAGEEAQRRLEVSLERRLGALGDHPRIRVSARTGRGTRRIFPLLERLGAAAARRIPTAELNRWLEECVAAHEPAMAQRGSRRRPLKFFYATQTGERPPSFALFCTQPDAVQESYRRYLENRLRQRFDLAGVPIRLRLRARRDGEKRAGRRS